MEILFDFGSEYINKQCLVICKKKAENNKISAK